MIAAYVVAAAVILAYAVSLAVRFRAVGRGRRSDG
jgi:hypothetical protein